VDVESLRFCFEALVMDSDLAGLQLEIDYRARRNRCERCGVEFAWRITRSAVRPAPVDRPRPLAERARHRLRGTGGMNGACTVEKKVLSENDRIATELRRRFADEGTLVFNFISSPGSGKTLFLERTLEALPRIFASPF